MDTDHVVLSRRGEIAILTLNRPDRMNAMSREMLLGLGRHLRDLAVAPDVRAIVLTGAGDRAFCAGADLKHRQSMTENDVRANLALYRSELGAVDRSPKPVVAAINGVALGGGLEIALACDLRVASSSALLGLPETSLGIIPGGGGTQRLPRLIGEARAKELILLARRLTAAEALAYGLVHRVSPQGTSVLEDALSYIEPIATGAPIAQSAALRAIDVSQEVSLERGLELEQVYYDECLRSEDRVTALAAFAKKTKPVFQGK